MSTIATPNQKLLVGVSANSSERVSSTIADAKRHSHRWMEVTPLRLAVLRAGIFIGAVALDYVGEKKNAPNWLIGLLGIFSSPPPEHF